ncbi:hypothetical protein QQ056_15610, partial [Oscillatoria laete-virens NRMC-F 0139]
MTATTIVESPQALSNPLRRLIPIIGISVLVFFALVQTMPFVLTIANSFKCLPAVQQNPTSFIPLPPFGV